MGGSAITSDTLFRTQWSHVAVVLDNSQLKIYRDGELSAETAASPSDDFSDGFRFGTPDHWYTRVLGDFDQIRLWSRALPESEIREYLHRPRDRSAVCNDQLEIYLEYSDGGYIDAAGKHLMVVTSGSQSTETATGPIGTGSTDRQVVTSAGTTSFGNDLSIDFGTAPDGEIAVTQLNGTPHGDQPSAEPMMATYWVVHNYGTVQNGLNATMTFTEAGFVTAAIPDAANYHLYKRGSTDREAWEGPFPASSVNQSTGAVTFSGIDGFSQFAVVRSNNAVLPVEWLDFTARHQGGGVVRLDWTTALEENNAGFEVERSADGRTFQTIGWVPGQNEGSHYEYLDRALPVAAPVLYYRLRQLDTDGQQNYSAVRSVVLERATSYTLFPNPATGAVTLRTPTPPASAGTVRVVDVLGRTVWERPLAAAAATWTLDLHELARGTYLVEVTDGATVWTERLVLR